MANPHSNHHHQRQQQHNQQQQQPHQKPKLAQIPLGNFENTMGGSNGANGSFATSSNGNQHSWQSDQQHINLDDFNLDQFNLVNYVTADSNTPLEEMEKDEIEKQKSQAQYTQMQLEHIYGDELRDRQLLEQQSENHGLPTILTNPMSLLDTYPDHMLSHHHHNDFASVPNFAVGTENMELEAYREEEVGTPQMGGFGQNLDVSGTLVPSTSRASLQTQQQFVQMRPVVHVKQEMIKEEPSEHEDIGSLSLANSVTSSRASSVGSGAIYTTAMTTSSGGTLPKPRKYRMKPDSEKQNPNYRLKRQKNNDAVRRSRDKAKQQQMVKDVVLEQLKQQVQDQAQQIADLEAMNAELEAKYQRLRQNCRCGAAMKLQRR